MSETPPPIFLFLLHSRMSDNLKVKLEPGASAPERKSTEAAGYDLCSWVDVVISARGHAAVPTGVRVAIPSGHYGRIAARSGLAVRNGITVGAGVIDRDYRGIIAAVLFNNSDQDFVVQKGERIAQLILEKCSTPEVEIVEDLDETDRGEGGFGSTDSKKQRTE